MPQVQAIDLGDNREQPTGIEGFFSKLGKSIKDQADRKEIGSLINEYKQNREDTNAWENLQLGLETSNISPTKRLETQKNLNEIKKVVIERDKTLNAQVAAKQEKARAKESVYELYKPHMSEEEARRLSAIDNEATARSKVSQLTKKDKPASLSAFERTLQNEEAKKLVKLEEDIPKARDALANLDRIEQLGQNELSGIKGYGKAILGTESAQELKNLSFTAIEPIIKLFNPVGPIPVQKLKIIQKQFQIHPSDIQSTQKGKIAALRRIGQQGLARAQERAALIRQYKGNPPPEELQAFDQQSSQLEDALVNQESFSVKMKAAKEDDLIDGLYSAKDGRKLKPIPKKEAEKLFDQGLITNVPSS